MKRYKLFYLIGLLFLLAAALNFVTGGDHATAVVWRCLGATFLLLGCSQQKNKAASQPRRKKLPGLQFFAGLVRIPDRTTEFRQKRGMIMSTKTIYSTATTRFDLSAAALHILAMALMLMDHLWATLLPAQEWLTCAGRVAFPIFAFMAVEGYFHTHDLKNTPCVCCCLPCFQRSPST